MSLVLTTQPPAAHGVRLTPSRDRSVRRSRRVTVVLAGVVLLSLADLVLTVLHLRTVGMSETNPIAAWIIEITGSWLGLTSYKTLTVLVSVGVLYRLRRHLSGEIASWCCLGLLTGLSFVWSQYALVSANFADESVVSIERAKGDWYELD